MKKNITKKIIAWTLISWIVLWISWIASTSAMYTPDMNNWQQKEWEVMLMNKSIDNNVNKQVNELALLKSLLKTKTELTEEDLSNLKKVLSDYSQSWKEIFESVKNSWLVWTWTSMEEKEEIIQEHKNKMIEITEDFKEKLLPYIKEDKIEDFNKYIEAKIEYIKNNVWKPNIDNIKKPVNIQKPKMLLTKPMKDNLIKTFNKISVEKRELFLNKVIEKIDNLLQKEITEKKKQLLIELKDFIKNEYLSSIEDEAIINEVIAEDIAE